MNPAALLVIATLVKSPDVRPPAPPVIYVDNGEEMLGEVILQVPPIVNPSGVSFTASPDHNVTENGTVLVAKYTMDVSSVATPPVVVKPAIDLGKPTPDATNTITWMSFAPIRVTLPAGNYTAVVCAEGPGGRTCSATTDPFTVAVRAAGATGKPVWKQ